MAKQLTTNIEREYRPWAALTPAEQVQVQRQWQITQWEQRAWHRDAHGYWSWTLPHAAIEAHKHKGLK